MKKIIVTPVTDEAIAELRAGDIFYLSGTLATGRDDVHRRVVHEGMPCPFDFRGLAIFHAGPIVREAAGAVQEVRINHGGHGVPRSFGTKIFYSSVKLRVLRGKKFFLDNSEPSGEGEKYEIISVGPTSSIRMEEWAADFIAHTGVKIMIGKGGMGSKTAAACREHKALHCVYPGGCAVLGASQTKKVTGVYWRELGMPECLWVMQVREFGPLMVSIDTQGNNLFAENAALYASRKMACMKPIIDSLNQ